MVKTITLSGAETEVSLSGGKHVIVKNNGDTAIYASKSSGIQAKSDGVYTINSGELITIENALSISTKDWKTDFFGSLFLKGTGDVQLITTNTVNFRAESKGGGNVDELKSSAILSKGVLANNTDVNTVFGNSVWLINSSYTYSNIPTGETAGFLFVTTTGGWTYQEFSAFSSSNVYKRRGKEGGTWSDWKLITPTQYSTTGKYVAFGDSLTWGAVWGATQGVHYTQANEKYRIPTRIAIATGLENNFDNQGSSGAGYVKVGSAGDTITGNVLAYDFTGVSLITVMGGANDKSTIDLGTSAASANDGTICGAIKAIIEHVKANAPKATLVIIQPLPSGSTSIGANNDVWDGKERQAGWSLNDFDTEVSKLCKDNHTAYVNWWESNYCVNWKTHSGGYNMNTGPNYSHPKIAHDYSLLGNFIGGKIAAFYKGRN